MIVVAVETNPAFRAGPPRVLFSGPYPRLVWLDANFDVAADGQRFLMVRESEPTRSPREINIVQNWMQELERLVPAN
jgi:hypothetical protein